MRLSLSFRQDTPVHSKLEIEVPDDATPAQVRAMAEAEFRQKEEDCDLDRDVSFDCCGLKIEYATDRRTGKNILEDELLEVDLHNLGVEAQLYLTGQTSLDEFKAKAKANGVEPVEDMQGPQPG